MIRVCQEWGRREKKKYNMGNLKNIKALVSGQGWWCEPLVPVLRDVQISVVKPY